VTLNPSNSDGRAPHKCSYCGEPFWVLNPQWMPFCSRRCQELDLSNWLTESYGLPYEGDESDPRREPESTEDEL